MSSIRFIALAMVMAAHVTLARAAPLQPDPASPAADSMPVSYHSAFEGYQPMREAGESPDAVWRAANQEVGNAGGHGAHLSQQEKPAAQAAPSYQSMAHKEKAK